MVIERKLSEGQVIDPIILLVRDVGPEVRLKGLIRTLRKAIGLGMVSGRVLELNLKHGCQFSPKRGNERGATVGYNGLRESVVTKHTIKKHPRESGSVKRLGAGNEMRIARKAVADDPDRIVAMRNGQLYDEIHGY